MSGVQGQGLLWAARWILSATIMLPLSSAVAQEVCGLQTASYDILFKDGFETPVSGLGPPVSTVSPPALGVTPTVTITFPANGATITSPRVQVAGTFTGPSATGISVNGVRAYVHNGTFVTVPLTLPSGASSISATATTIDGLSATDTKSATSTVATSGLALSADVTAGFKPLGVGFSPTVAGVTPASATLDFGDGSPPYTGTSLLAVHRHTYAAAGIYIAQATITDAQSNTFTATYRIAVLDVLQQRQTLCAVYAHLRSRMASGDASGALNAYHVPQRQKYGKLFTALGANLATAAGRLGTIANGVVGLDDAELMLVTEQSAQVSGFPLHMSPDHFGVWRIDSM